MAGFYHIDALYQAQLAKDNILLDQPFILYTDDNIKFYDLFHNVILDEHYKVINQKLLLKYFTKKEKALGFIVYPRVVEIAKQMDVKSKSLKK